MYITAVCSLRPCFTVYPTHSHQTRHIIPYISTIFQSRDPRYMSPFHLRPVDVTRMPTLHVADTRKPSMLSELEQTSQERDEKKIKIIYMYVLHTFNLIGASLGHIKPLVRPRVNTAEIPPLLRSYLNHYHSSEVRVSSEKRPTRPSSGSTFKL